MPPRHLTEELHCHLYGCLTPEDLWTLGRDRYKKVEPRLAWYADEYAKAYGRRPDPHAYWASPSGIDILRRDFLFTTPAPFARFQASFNLAIALLPITPDDTTVLRHVLAEQRASGLSYGEYRCFVPPHLSEADIKHYIGVAADTTIAIANESAEAFIPRLVFSLARRPEIGLKQYNILKQSLTDKPGRRTVVTAIDFCGAEEGHPPSLTEPLVARILADNINAPEQALAVLYHVGESFADKSLPSAVRWVWQAHAMGAHRLGHALALGIDPYLHVGRSVSELASERRAHLAWLLASRPWLEAHGYHVDGKAAELELNSLASHSPDDHTTMHFDAAAADDCRKLQDAVMADLAAKQAVIESCPTSNMLIGDLTPPTHPLPRFIAAGLDVIIGADDPGIFATSLMHEEQLLSSKFSWTEQQLASCAQLSHESRSSSLVGRFPTSR